MTYYPQQPGPAPQQPYPNQQQAYGQPQAPVQQSYPVRQYPVQQVPVQQAPQVYQPQAYPVPYGQPIPVQPQLTPEQQRQKTYRRHLRKTANSLGAIMLIFFGLEVILGVVITMISGSISDSAETLSLLENGVLSVLIFFLCGLIYCLIKRVRFAEIFPFRKAGASMIAKLSVIGLTYSLMSNYVVDMLNKTFGLFGIQNNGGIIDAGSEPNVLMYFLTVAILPALVEEFAFRGIVMGLIRPYSEGLAILLSSATFALMHGNFVQMPFTFCCGLVFAYMDIKTDSLLPSIIVHFLNNGLSVLFDILLSYDILSENMVNVCYGVIFLTIAALSFIFLKRMIDNDSGDLFRLKNGDTGLPFKKKVTTVATSPTLIVFAVLMSLYSVLILFSA